MSDELFVEGVDVGGHEAFGAVGVVEGGEVEGVLEGEVGVEGFVPGEDVGVTGFPVVVGGGFGEDGGDVVVGEHFLESWVVGFGV